MTSHTATASITTDKRIDALDKRISDVEKDVMIQNTELRVLREMCYELLKASAEENTGLKGLTKVYENRKQCRETGGNC